jgi:branched-chain amino acid transport system ATP-binding protein
VEILKADSITKTFGGLLAVDNCSFSVKANLISSIIGPNGAGKTTIFNIISGLVPLSSGSIEFDGRTSLTNLATHEITKLGIGRTFQNIHLFKELTVLENVKIGQHCRTRAGILASLCRSKSQKIEESEVSKKAKQLLQFVGLGHYGNQSAMNLSYGDQRRVEIARALATEPKLVMLDEPNSGMNNQETEQLIELVRKIREAGVTVLVISHHMKFVHNISDFVLVLNYGKIIAEGKPDEVISNKEVIKAYLGEKTKL